MTIEELRYELLLADARTLGREGGRAAASYYFDGNTSDATYAAVARGLNEGDPAVLDTIPCSPLSGEWADDPTAADILAALGVAEDDDAADDYLSAYEQAFSEAAYESIERETREHLRSREYEAEDAAGRALAPTLRHDYDVLRACEREGGVTARETAVVTRRLLAADTLAPAWLRKYADEVVERLRQEER